MCERIQDIAMKLQGALREKEITLWLDNTDCRNWCFFTPDELRTPLFVLIGYKGKPLPKGDSNEKISKAAGWLEELKPLGNEGLSVDPELLGNLSIAADTFTTLIDCDEWSGVSLYATVLENDGRTIPALVLKAVIGDYVLYNCLAGLRIDQKHMEVE